MRRDLRIKSQELEVKNAAANDKLKKMVKDQQEAEKKKVKKIVKSLYTFIYKIEPIEQVLEEFQLLKGRIFSLNFLIGYEPGDSGTAAQAAGGHCRQADECERRS